MITSGIKGQTSLSNTGSDSAHFLLPPLTISFMAANVIPVFSTHVTLLRIENKEKSDIMFGIPAPYNHLF